MDLGFAKGGAFEGFWENMFRILKILQARYTTCSRSREFESHGEGM